MIEDFPDPVDSDDVEGAEHWMPPANMVSVSHLWRAGAVPKQLRLSGEYSIGISIVV